jgi:hypothetical protein
MWKTNLVTDQEKCKVIPSTRNKILAKYYGKSRSEISSEQEIRKDEI